jgi:hypothetical protein
MEHDALAAGVADECDSNGRFLFLEALVKHLALYISMAC